MRCTGEPALSSSTKFPDGPWMVMIFAAAAAPSVTPLPLMVRVPRFTVRLPTKSGLFTPTVAMPVPFFVRLRNAFALNVPLAVKVAVLLSVMVSTVLAVTVVPAWIFGPVNAWPTTMSAVFDTFVMMRLLLPVSPVTV